MWIMWSGVSFFTSESPLGYICMGAVSVRTRMSGRGSLASISIHAPGFITPIGTVLWFRVEKLRIQSPKLRKCVKNCSSQR